MARHIELRPRNQKNRKTKPTILFGIEGKNETEKNYFKDFQKRDNPYNIQFSCGRDTNPENILENLLKTMEDKNISPENGDIIFCVFDSDFKRDKQAQIDRVKVKACENNINMIMSVPAFEFWYLLHYEYTSHKFKSANELEKYLKKYISNYDKNMKKVNSITIDKVEQARENAIKLKKEFNLKDEDVIDKVEYLPSTDVYKIIDTLNELNKNN